MLFEHTNPTHTWHFPWRRAGLILVSMWLFMLALQLIRFSLQNADLTTISTETVQRFLNDPIRSFAVGWIGNTIVLSGSPVSALGVSLFASGFQSDTTSLAALIFGSRSGPDLLMFVVGIVTLIKGRNVPQSFTIGILEFFTTASMAICGILMYALFFDHLSYGSAAIHWFNTSTGYTSILEFFVNPAAQLILARTGPLLGVIIGFSILVSAILLFDKFFAFVTIAAKRNNPEDHTVFTRWFYKFRFKWEMSHGGKLLRWMYDYLKLPLMAFILGALITGLTMSVAISVSLVIPFYAYGMITERSAVAYIVASNVTTFIDTFFISLLTQNQEIASTVIGVILSITITACIFLFGFKYYAHAIKTVSLTIAKRPWTIIAFIIITIVLPIPALLR